MSVWGCTVARRLVHAREEAGLTQSQLAEKIRRSVGYVSNMESGKLLVSVEMAVKLADAFGQWRWMWLEHVIHERLSRAGLTHTEVHISGVEAPDHCGTKRIRLRQQEER